MIEPIGPGLLKISRRAGRPKGSGHYVAHNALAQAFWKHHIDWKDELATLYLRYRNTGKKNAHESLKIWIALLPYLSLSEKQRADKQVGRFKKRAKVTKNAVAALKRLEAQAAQARPLTLKEQAAYAPVACDAIRLVGSTLDDLPKDGTQIS